MQTRAPCRSVSGLKGNWQGPVAQYFSVFWCKTYLASVVLPTFTLIPDIYSIEILVWCCSHPRLSVFIIFKLMLHSNNETLLLICSKCSFQDASSDTLWWKSLVIFLLIFSTAYHFFNGHIIDKKGEEVQDKFFILLMA